MLEAAIPNQNEETQKPISLYRHVKCPDWGVAILAWEKSDRRGYQFEDGKLRIFKEGFYSFMREQDVSVDEAAPILTKLYRHVGLPEVGAGTRGKPVSAIGFDDQKIIFTVQYPDGFQSDTWKRKMRGVKAKRRLKRHRDSAITRAREVFAQSELDRVIAAGDHDAFIDTMVEFLRSTDLVTAAQLKTFASMAATMRQGFVEALRDLLHGDDDYVHRFDRFVRALTTPGRGKPSWQLVTAFSALMYPDQHVCVRPTSFRAQAVTMAPTFEFGKAPHGRHYRRLVDMAHRVTARLRKEGFEPHDLLDVYDFMWLTLRPAARKLLDAAPARKDDDVPAEGAPVAGTGADGAGAAEAAVPVTRDAATSETDAAAAATSTTDADADAGADADADAGLDEERHAA